MPNDNPLKRALDEWLPDSDFAVLSHGFAPHGRDYVLVVQADGTYELTLTHVTDLRYETRVGDEVWPESWDDHFTDYKAWLAAEEPDGYVWGTNWSLAYPGLRLLEGDAGAAHWSERLGRPMHAIALETDRFILRLVFHDARAKRLSDDRSIIDRALTPVEP
jgi:hypothetical protein